MKLKVVYNLSASHKEEFEARGGLIPFEVGPIGLLNLFPVRPLIHNLSNKFIIITPTKPILIKYIYRIPNKFLPNTIPSAHKYNK